MKQTPLKRSKKGLRRTPLGHASAEQKLKVKREGCRLSALHDSTLSSEIVVDPAHVTPRALGGCDEALCVIGLTRHNHLCYDRGELDILPWLSLEEQAHAVSHLGILGALRRTTGDEYAVVPKEAP